MICEKKQNLTSSEVTVRKALEEEKSVYQSNWLGTESPMLNNSFYLLDWPWRCNHAIVALTQAVNRVISHSPSFTGEGCHVKIW